MKQKKWIIAGLMVVGAILLGALMMNRPPTSPMKTDIAQVFPVANTPAVPEITPAESSTPLVQLTKRRIPQSKPAISKSQKNLPSQTPKEPLHDPGAREALALVGLDPQAEQYWLDAIFDTSLPDNEREDLMEDLNEVGFADPKNLTADDLPLIANRLQIIEELEPGINDPFMSEHLGEAHKDLLNMYAKAAGQ
jgi:hypothetical protein